MTSSDVVEAEHVPSRGLFNFLAERRSPDSNFVSGGRTVSRAAMSPNNVRVPVVSATAVAVPLMTDVPRNTR